MEPVLLIFAIAALAEGSSKLIDSITKARRARHKVQPIESDKQRVVPEFLSLPGGEDVCRSEEPAADSDEVAQVFRLDVAHRSDFKSPGVPR